jgi:hypothetical protein
MTSVEFDVELLLSVVNEEVVEDTSPDLKPISPVTNAS